jgi:hypothetical protein
VNEHILNNLHKAETHRLGYELSEDAVTWNVFVALSKAGMLSEIMSWLAGRKIAGEPELYLWGCRVDFNAGKFVPYSLLKEARAVIEPDIKRFPTEPDVMLIVPGKSVMLIEAKFTSGNTLAQSDGVQTVGEKPKHAGGLLDRYLYRNAFGYDKRCIVPERIGSRFHSQLFRNIVFAAGIAEKFNGDWQVVNLVRSTGNHRIRLISNVDFGDPTDAVRCYLAEGYKERFTFRIWEGLYASVVKREPKLNALTNYLKGKSAFLRPAFNLSNVLCAIAHPCPRTSLGIANCSASKNVKQVVHSVTLRARCARR